MQSHQLNHTFINYKHNRWVVNIGAIAIAPYGRIKEQSMKLRSLHIENYKMFKDFDISFVDENDKALPIVVLAGVNGSGKTTILEFISQCAFENDLEKSFIEVDVNIYQNIKLTKVVSLDKSTINLSIDNKNDSILYFHTNKDLTELKVFLPKYIESMVYDKGIPPFDAYIEVTEYINEILKELKVEIEFDSRDGEGNLFFRNKSGGDKFSIDELSTGEKTLMSKVLYLYLEDIRDKVILIDEPELSLHPSWQNKVLKIYENFALKNNCQIIIATHSPHIIGSAKPEYIRLLKKEDDRIIAIANINRSYGLEFDKVLTDIMGVENLRTPDVAKNIQKLWDLLEDEDYESQEYIDLYNSLEKLLGSLDKDMVLARLEIARIKSENAKSK